MKTINICTLLALVTVETSAQVAGSCHDGFIDIALVGDTGSGGYPNFTLSVPEDGSTVAITNPLVVYSLTPPYYPLDCPAKCTFLGAEGALSYYYGSTLDVDGPQAQLSVTCVKPDAAEAFCETATTYDDSQLHSCTAEGALGSFPTPGATASAATTLESVTPTGITSATSTAAFVSPPYPTNTGASIVVAPTGTSAPASLVAKSTGGVAGTNGTVVPFTGAAARAVGSISGVFLAFLGIIANV